MDDIKQLAGIVEASDNIVFFGGAGVSTESGIRDFRGKHGIYTELKDDKAEIVIHQPRGEVFTQLMDALREN